MRVFLDLLWYFRQERLRYGIGVMTLIFISLLMLYPPYVVRLIIDGISDDTMSRGRLIGLLLQVGVIAFLAYGLRFVWRTMIFGSAVKLGRLLRDRLYSHFTRLSPSFYHRNRTGDLMAHATNDIQAIEQTAGEGVLTAVDSLSTGLAVIFSMAIFINWKLTLLALLPMPFMAWSTSYYGNLLHERFFKAQEAFSSINDKVQENVTGVRVVKAFGQQEAEIEAFRELSDDVVEKNMAVARVDSLFDPTINLIVGVSFFLSIAGGSWFVHQDEMTIGQLTQFTIYLGHLIWPMLAVGWMFNIVERGRASYDRVKSLLDTKPEIADKPGAAAVLAPGDVRFDIAGFTFPGAARPALRDIRVTLPQGGTLGVVGRTGSGKTALLRLLLREFDLAPEAGEIRIGVTPIGDVTLSALRHAIGYVPQEHVLFSATIAENIAFARPEAGRAEVEAAARLAAIHEDIARFPEGYDTVVGERGVTLSGGQKQRISIARALLQDPDILVLDDALSAVDGRTERAILDALRENRQGKTTIITAHRMSAIEHADRIIVLADGAVAEQGTHGALMARDGWYRSMVQRQQLESLVEEGGAVHGRP